MIAPGEQSALSRGVNPLHFTEYYCVTNLSIYANGLVRQKTGLFFYQRKSKKAVISFGFVAAMKLMARFD